MMLNLLKEVARGKRGARDLNYTEAVQAAEALINGSATAAQAGAFLIAERIKMESLDEIKAFVDTLRTYSTFQPIPHGLDCAGPYDGRSRSFFATFPTAFVLSANGVPVTLHGSAALPPKHGITLMDMLNVIVNEAGESPDSIQSNSHALVRLISTEDWCPPLAKLRPLRQEIGMRTVFNTAEKLLRLTEASYMAVGVFHGTILEKMAELLNLLEIKRALVIQGIEGSEDFSVEKRTRVQLVSEGKSELMVVDPELYELQSVMPEEHWTPELQVETAQAVLKGEASLAYTNMVLLNSGIRLWLTEIADSIEEGIYAAKHTLDQGLAWKAYESWRASL